MTRRSPIVAMLWENWRLSRVEAAQRLAQGIVAASAALTLFDADATMAFWILIATHAFFWFSIAKLNGGRFMDGYKPGFPLYLLYSRPVPTVRIVGVAMVYDAVSCTAFYLVSAAFLRFAFGPPLPLFSVAVFLMAYHFASTSVQWSTRNRVVQWIGSMVTFLPFLALLKNRLASPLHVEFSLLENALMVLIGVVSFGLTVAGVARQRRGDAIASVPRTAGSGGYPDWLVTLFRFPCPTSSTTRAQVWFELRSSGLPVLAIGLALAMLIPLLVAISIPFAPARHVATSFMVLAIPVGLLTLGGNAFGIRRKQGRTYASAFEATQPHGTAQLVGLKVLVRTACLLAALIAIGVSVSASSSLMSAWGEWLADGKKDVLPGLLHMRRTIGDSFGGLTGYAVAAQVVMASVAVVVMVAARAAFTALRARYPRQLNIAGLVLLLHGFLLVLLGLAFQLGIASQFVFYTAQDLTNRVIAVVAAASVLATVYLLWRVLAERLLTLGQACGAILVSAAFGAAWVTLLTAAGVPLSTMPATDVVGVSSPALLPLMAIVLAPWSLSRIRHA
jgi:hypothetical protein